MDHHHFFLAIGLSSLLVHQRSVDDYLIGGRQMGPWLSALSAASTNCSGFMFIGLIGLSYTQGIYAFWFFIGIVLGSLLAWTYWVPKLQKQSAHQKSLTYLHSLADNKNVDTIETEEVGVLQVETQTQPNTLKYHIPRPTIT